MPATPNVLVTTEWVPQHAADATVRVVEVDVDTAAYDQGHVPGAAGWNADNNNWFAAWAFWQLKVYGHDDERIMDGGREKWLAEGRDLSTDKPAFVAKTYTATGPV